MRRKSRQVIMLIATFLLASMLLLPAFTIAGEAAEGRIEVRMMNIHNPDEAVGGVKFAVCQIAAGSPYDGSELTAAFADAGVTVDQLISGDPDVARTLQAYAKKTSPANAGGGTTDSAGSASVAGLADGIYLVYQTNSDADFAELGYQAAFGPFLVYLPKQNDDGSFTRNVTCKGKCEKTELAPDTIRVIVEKHWEDQNNKLGIRPGKIKVGLYDPDQTEPVDVVELTPGTSNADQWRHEWTGLDPSVSWSVDEIDTPQGYRKAVSVEGDSALITFTITNTAQPTESREDPTPTPPGDETPTPTPPGDGTPTPTPPGSGTPTPRGSNPGGGSGRTSSVKTGDNSAIGFLTLLIALSGFVILAVSSGRRKRN